MPKDYFGAYVERKLFMHNMSHATAAYLGYLRGHEYIWQAVEDDEVREIMQGAFAEAIEGLVKKWGLDKGELEAHAQDLTHRYRNKALGDQVRRIAADPIRKLGPNDRLIGTARMCIEQGIKPHNIAVAAAAAIRYDNKDDAASRSVQQILKIDDVGGVLETICQLETDSPLASLINNAIEQLHHKGWTKQD